HTVFRRLCREAGLPATGESEHELAVRAGFVPVGASKQHLNEYDSHIRVAHIFDGDRALYRTLRGASGALEHGYGGFGDVQKKAHASADDAFRCVRRAILRELGVRGDSSLTTKKYDHLLGGWPATLEVAGTYTGDPDPGWP